MKNLVAAVLIVVGVLALAAGFVYVTQPAHSLPSFFPSHVSAHAVGAAVFHRKKGALGIAAGTLLVVVGTIVALIRPAGRGAGSR